MSDLSPSEMIRIQLVDHRNQVFDARHALVFHETERGRHVAERRIHVDQHRVALGPGESSREMRCDERHADPASRAQHRDDATSGSRR